MPGGFGGLMRFSEEYSSKINIKPTAILHNPRTDKPGKGKNASIDNKMIRIDIPPTSLIGVTDELKYGLEIRAVDTEKYLSGEDNKIIFNVDIEDINAQTDFTSVYMLKRANDEIIKELYKGETWCCSL